MKRVDHTKFLGVIIDDKLNWSFHINSIKNKIAKGIGVIYKARRLLNKSTLITLYYSFLYSYLDYGIIAWGNTYQSYLDSIIKIQKRAVRTISSASRCAHTEPIFKELVLLPLRKIYTLNVSVFMHKYHLRVLPDVFLSMFVRNSAVHAYHTRQSDLSHVPSWRLEIVCRSIRVQSVRIWNFMSDKIEYNCLPATYKCNAKRYLLKNNIDNLG